ncbi:hypothetical protein RIF29_18482 [Crotalaria pallida]|uniref:Uncharacterized protein n=1 Tax=Crotalaria pallida TaxID=3830 RepID=A0AAN9IKS5_CROPI
MESEDFSFPRINDTCAHNIDSPPLWNLSPAASPNPYHYQENKGEEENDCFKEKVIAHGQRKSFSCIEIGRKRIGLEDHDYDYDDDHHEDKMDLLWEDFNEELLSSTTGSSATSSSREVVEFRSCAPSLTVAKARNNNALVSSKNKPSMVMIVKILKKLFSINNNNNVQGRQRKRVT